MQVAGDAYGRSTNLDNSLTLLDGTTARSRIEFAPLAAGTVRRPGSVPRRYGAGAETTNSMRITNANAVATAALLVWASVAGDACGFAGSSRPTRTAEASGLVLQAEDTKLVEDVLFSGNRRIPDDSLRLWVLTRVGEPYSAEQVRKDLRTILAQGYFEDAKVFTEEGPRGGLIVRRRSIWPRSRTSRRAPSTSTPTSRRPIASRSTRSATLHRRRRSRPRRHPSRLRAACRPGSARRTFTATGRTRCDTTCRRTRAACSRTPVRRSASRCVFRSRWSTCPSA